MNIKLRFIPSSFLPPLFSLKRAAVFLFIFFASILHGQPEKIKVKKKDTKPKPYSYLTADVYYGFKSFKNSFYNQLNRLDNFKLSSPLNIIGFGISGYDFYLNPNGHVVFQTSLSIYQRSSIRVSDSIPSKIQGFSYNFGLGKIFRTRNRRFSTVIYLGFNTGRLRLSPANRSQSANPFFSPKLSIQPKIMLTRKIGLSVIVDYEFDISKGSWRNSQGLVNYNQTGLVGLISLGYCLR